MTEQQKREAFAALHQDIVYRLMQIEDSCGEYGLSALTHFTVIARDPNNDDMCLVVTNEEDIAKGCTVAMNNAKIAVKQR